MWTPKWGASWRRSDLIVAILIRAGEEIIRVLCVGGGTIRVLLVRGQGSFIVGMPQSAITGKVLDIVARANNPAKRILNNSDPNSPYMRESGPFVI